METRLVDSLLYKLDELEHKVQLYRRNVIGDFQRYFQDLTRDVNPPIDGSQIQLVSAATDRDLRSAKAGETSVTLKPSSFQSAPYKAVFGRTLDANQRGLDLSLELRHEREVEFQGLFTPSYLPLLDNSSLALRPNPPPHLPSGSQVEASTSEALPSPPWPALTGITSTIASTVMGPAQDVTSDVSEVTETQPYTHVTPLSSDPAKVIPRPSASRRATADLTSPIISQKNDSQIPRSALRRASTPGRPMASPRRVRFEFEGLEVLPTASPHPSDSRTRQATSPSPPSPIEDIEEDVDPCSADSILGPDKEESLLPPPRKISSSDALRALSRTPLEAGTVWTVVNADSNTSAFPLGDDSSPQSQNDEFLQQEATSPAGHIGGSPGKQLAPSPMNRPETSWNHVREGSDIDHREHSSAIETEPSSDEEDFLSIARGRSFSNKKPMMTTVAHLAVEKVKSPSPVGRNQLVDEPGPTSSDDLELDSEDEMFQFETGGLSAPPRPRTKSPPPVASSQIVGPGEPLQSSPLAHESSHATSLAVSIAQPPPSAEEKPSPTTAKFQAGSVGSYKGRPVVMPIVKDPAVHTQAASLGQFSTFVGGLDGRSGLDEGDQNSFRASFVRSSFSGAPRSLTERMMMEDAERETRQ